MNKTWSTILLLISCIISYMISGACYAQNIKVGTIEREPFSYKDESWEWTWFSVELWKSVAQENSFEYKFVEYTNFSEMVQDTKDKKNDISVANISITTEREKVLDFSSPIYDSWLNIWELSENSGVFIFYDKYISYILLWLKVFWWLFLAIIHYFFVFNVARWNISIFSYPREIFAISWEVLEQTRNAFWSKLLFPPILITGIFIVTLMSQKFTFALNDIDANKLSPESTLSYQDITEAQVGTTNWSVGIDFLEKSGFSVAGYDTLDEIYNDLLEKDLEYIVADDPIIRFKAKNDPRFRVVWKTFNKDKYAFLFPQYENKQNIPLIKRTNISILKMQESWYYDRIYNKYFE